MLRIGEFARLGGVSAKALRLYDARGLLPPAWVDADSGYRYYSPAQLPELRRVVALRHLGVSLADIKALVADGADLGAVLARRRETLEEEHRRAASRLAELDMAVEMADDGPDVVIRGIPAERVAALEASVGPETDIGPLFREVEAVVRDGRVRAPRPPGVVVGDGPAPFSVTVFVPVRGAVSSGRVRTVTLPAVRAATALHRGPYAGMVATRHALTEWIIGAGYEAGGPQRVVYLQFGAKPEFQVPASYVVSEGRQYLTELQIPIK